MTHARLIALERVIIASQKQGYSPAESYAIAKVYCDNTWSTLRDDQRA